MSESNTTVLAATAHFFNGASPEHLSALEDLGEQVDLEARTTVFEEYERADKVYVILSGEVSLVICERGECRQIGVVGEGDILGWSGVLQRSRLFDTAVTNTPVTALVFDSKALMDYCEENPSFGFLFMRKAAAALASRLSGTRLQLMQMCGNRFPTFDVNLEND